MGRRALLSLALLLGSCGGGGTAASAIPLCLVAAPLAPAEIETIIEQAAARATADGRSFLITVTSRGGEVIGQFRMAGAPGDAAARATGRRKARTAGFLSSNGHAFSTRTARFIIGDHFPPDLPNTPGGPLYGVQFSSLSCSDVVGEDSGLLLDTGNGLSGDPGAIPLFRGGCLVGGVGVEGGGDGPDDQAAEERAAFAAAAGFRPPEALHGSNILIDGIRFEFLEETPADLPVTVPYAALPGDELVAPVAAPVLPPVFGGPAPFGGLPCEIAVAPHDSPSAAATKLLEEDVRDMLDAAAARADRTRAAIRAPLGAAAQVFVAVVDAEGELLGCIRTPDATLFSLDVSVQKARAALFFSSDDAAITTRALGFLAQRFFPPGIDAGPNGPLYLLQDALNPLCAVPGLPLRNGITVFPGGVPVYKAGLLVGAIGVSGDGVDQDDYIASAGAELFPPPAGARGDELSETGAVTHLRARVAALALASADAALDAACATADARLASQGTMGLRLPYVKFPRQPER